MPLIFFWIFIIRVSSFNITSNKKITSHKHDDSCINTLNVEWTEILDLLYSRCLLTSQKLQLMQCFIRPCVEKIQNVPSASRFGPCLWASTSVWHLRWIWFQGSNVGYSHVLTYIYTCILIEKLSPKMYGRYYSKQPKSSNPKSCIYVFAAVYPKVLGEYINMATCSLKSSKRNKGMCRKLQTFKSTTTLTSQNFTWPSFWRIYIAPKNRSGQSRQTVTVHEVLEKSFPQCPSHLRKNGSCAQHIGRVEEKVQRTQSQQSIVVLAGVVWMIYFLWSKMVPEASWIIFTAIFNKHISAEHGNSGPK